MDNLLQENPHMIKLKPKNHQSKQHMNKKKRIKNKSKNLLMLKTNMIHLNQEFSQEASHQKHLANHHQKQKDKPKEHIIQYHIKVQKIKIHHKKQYMINLPIKKLLNKQLHKLEGLNMILQGNIKKLNQKKKASKQHTTKINHQNQH